MTILHRFLSEDETNETLCELGACVEEVNKLGSCSLNCFKECPYLCRVIEVTSLSPPPIVIHHDDDDNLKKFFIIAASSIITTLFLLTLLVLCFKFYQRRRRRSRRWSLEEEARNWDLDGSSSSSVIIDHPIWHIRTIGLNPSVISSIKVWKYSKQDGVVEGTECSVCLSEFEEEEMLRLLPKCKHAFHLSCIDTWLRSHTNCPLCRAPIVPIKDDHSESVVEEIHVRIQEEDGENNNEEVDERNLEEEERDGFDGNVSRDHGESKQRVRRSVSLDSLSGLRVSEVVVGGRGKEKVKRGNNVGSSIVGRSSFLKRSISYNGK